MSHGDEIVMPDKRPNNLKTALLLAALAVLFFAGVIIKQIWFR